MAHIRFYATYATNVPKADRGGPMGLYNSSQSDIGSGAKQKHWVELSSDIHFMSPFVENGLWYIRE